MTWFCPMRRAFISPSGLFVLSDEAVYAGCEAARWFAGYEGEIAVWEGWR